MGTPWLQILV